MIVEMRVADEIGGGFLSGVLEMQASFTNRSRSRRRPSILLRSHGDSRSYKDLESAVSGTGIQIPQGPTVSSEETGDKQESVQGNFMNSK